MDIYVGNLAYGSGDNDLKELFEAYGTVTSARVIMDKFSGQSRGFGFVEMPDKGEAETAVQNTNGSDFMGRSLRVNESQPRPRDGGRDGGRGGDRGGDRGDRDSRW
ncbi:MAG: RNA-binding protein [Lentisphaerae bacterium]|nr:RNA-binding protein [Lentisphaerota bacterium]